MNLVWYLLNYPVKHLPFVMKTECKTMSHAVANSHKQSLTEKQSEAVVNSDEQSLTVTNSHKPSQTVANSDTRTIMLEILRTSF